MAPILGIWASQISGHLFAPSGAYDSIATTTVGAGGTSSITFNSIPSTYTHLQIRAFTGTSTIYVSNAGYVSFNGDTTTSNYNDHAIYGSGASAASYSKLKSLNGSKTSSTLEYQHQISIGTWDGTKGNCCCC